MSAPRDVIGRAIEVLAEAQLLAEEANEAAKRIGPGLAADRVRELLERAHAALDEIERVTGPEELLRLALTAHEYARMARDEAASGSRG